ncbi:MAG: hypothetical protein LBS68_01960 [Puniceicoccales bacterium]|nr:hypothetical protein [Puniceicoccales bacterium]
MEAGADGDFLGGDRTLLASIGAAKARGNLSHGIFLVGPCTRSLANVAERMVEIIADPMDPNDCHRLYPLGKAQQIDVDSIRRLIENLQHSSRGSGPRVALIHRADRLHRSAANSLLKSLEEPPDGVFFVLTTTRPWEVLATVRSRCQTHRCAAPPPRRRNPHWTTLLADYKKFLCDAMECPTPAHLLDVYGLVINFRRIIGECLSDILPSADVSLDGEAAAAQPEEERRDILMEFFADLAGCVLTVMGENLVADEEERRKKVLFLSRQLRTINRAPWLLSMHCPEVAILEEIFSFPLSAGTSFCD